jgi:hypothetical protein
MNVGLLGPCAGALLAVALILSPIAANAPRAQAPSVGQRLSKLDTLLRADVSRHRAGSRRVIIRTRPGDRTAIQQLLAARGHATVADLAGDTLRGDLPAGVLEELAASNRILSVSVDAVVTPSADLLGGLLKTVTGTVNTLTTTAVKPLLNTVGNLLDPSLDTGGEPVPPVVLRQTLALPDRWSGNDVTVAVIDSGLEMSSEFQGRVKAFYDFTSGKQLATTPSDEYGHGTHVAGTIAGSGALSTLNEYRGIAASVDLGVL